MVNFYCDYCDSQFDTNTAIRRCPDCFRSTLELDEYKMDLIMELLEAGEEIEVTA